MILCYLLRLQLVQTAAVSFGVCELVLCGAEDASSSHPRRWWVVSQLALQMCFVLHCGSAVANHQQLCITCNSMLHTLRDML
jgi:short subunit fatty acids transporter